MAATQLVFAEPFFDLPGFSKPDQIDTAGSLYLRAHVISLGPAIKSQAAIAAGYEKTADDLLQGNEFALCMRRLNERTHLFEDILHLPYLAEACQRTVVSQCRRHNKLAKQMALKLKSGAENSSADMARGSSLLLADQVEELAKLFYRNQKLEIADRAFQDAIVTAGLAANPVDGDAQDKANLRRYYLDYALFLVANEHQEQALAVVERMNEVCGL